MNERTKYFEIFLNYEKNSRNVNNIVFYNPVRMLLEGHKFKRLVFIWSECVLLMMFTKMLLFLKHIILLKVTFKVENIIYFFNELFAKGLLYDRVYNFC